MSYVKQALTLTDDAVVTMLQAARKQATQSGQPQCIVIVDISGETLIKFRMDGSKFISLISATAKARTAASTRNSTSAIPDPVRPFIAAATQNQITMLPGGLPIVIDGHYVGGIGVGSGTGEQDVAVAKAALASINAETTLWD